MAIWQYILKIVSKDVDKGFDSSTVQDAVQQLAENLDRGESWNDRLAVYGDVESTCIEIWTGEGQVQEINARLDLRDISEEAAAAIVEFTRSINGMFQNTDGELINPDMQLLTKDMVQSDAYRFVKNPSEFLDAAKLD